MLSRCNLSLLHCRLGVQYVHATQCSRHGSIRYTVCIIIVVVDKIKSTRPIDDAQNNHGITEFLHVHYHCLCESNSCEFSSHNFSVFQKCSGFFYSFRAKVKSLNENNKKKKKTNNVVRYIVRIRMKNSFYNSWNLSFERKTIAILLYAYTYCM